MKAWGLILCLALCGCKSASTAPNKLPRVPVSAPVNKFRLANVFVIQTGPKLIAWGAVLEAGDVWQVQTTTNLLSDWNTDSSFTSVDGTNIFWQGYATNAAMFFRLKHDL